MTNFEALLESYRQMGPEEFGKRLKERADRECDYLSSCKSCLIYKCGGCKEEDVINYLKRDHENLV